MLQDDDGPRISLLSFQRHLAALDAHARAFQARQHLVAEVRQLVQIVHERNGQSAQAGL